MYMTGPSIYIMVNEAYPNYIKIGYSDDVERRLQELNAETGTMYPFQIYAVYQVDTPLSDKSVHDIIDMLNPNLRSKSIIDGKERVREFFEMSPEDGFRLLAAIANINGRTDHLFLWEKPEEESGYGPFEKRHLEPGTVLTFQCPDNPYDQEECFILDKVHVDWEDEMWTLNSLAQHFTNKKNVGTKYFFYNGKRLCDI